MIRVLRQIRGHDKVESLLIMLQVIEVLEKNFLVDDSMNNNEWNIVSKWLEKYYCELKELHINERSKTQGIQTELSEEK